MFFTYVELVSNGIELKLSEPRSETRTHLPNTNKEKKVLYAPQRCISRFLRPTLATKIKKCSHNMPLPLLYCIQLYMQRAIMHALHILHADRPLPTTKYIHHVAHLLSTPPHPGISFPSLSTQTASQPPFGSFPVPTNHGWLHGVTKHLAPCLAYGH